MKQAKLPASVSHPRSVQKYDERESGVKRRERAVSNGSIGVDFPEQRLFDQRVNPLEPGFIVRVADKVTVRVVNSWLIKPWWWGREYKLEEDREGGDRTAQPQTT